MKFARRLVKTAVRYRNRSDKLRIRRAIKNSVDQYQGLKRQGTSAISSFVEKLTRRQKQTVMMLADFVILPLALWSAFALRLGELNPAVGHFWPAFVVSAVVCVPIFSRLGLYRQVVRYIGSHALLVVVVGATITALSLFAAAFVFQLHGFPRSVPIIFWLIALVYVAGTRFLVRAYFQWLISKMQPQEPVIIYGAGANGAELARMLRQQGRYAPVAFLDDDKKAQRRVIDGIYVYGPKVMAQLLKDTQAKQVLVAIPSDAVESRKRIIEFLEPFAVYVRLIPDFGELVAGRQSIANIRDVQIQDLLGRDQIDPLPQLLSGSVAQRNVLITGAGGSIGSELCREILRQRPRMIVLLEQSEYGLYEIQRELRDTSQREEIHVPLVGVLGSVTDPAFLRRTFRSFAVETVYHAAAYKHVDLVERNVIQGLKNNTFGTLYAAEAAQESGVKDFILVSTDKAVRTTSVMGASKRMAEMILQALQDTTHDTRFSVVRFGNVLGSSGSVVPLFTEQIDGGGPVTVTDPEVTRYFMTVTEAAQLVLQAASMARGGDVFVLEMGEPVKILDLAHRMIRLKGLTCRDEDNPHGNIEVQFTGLKPGEKLHEELLTDDSAQATEHRKILRADEPYVPWPELRAALDTLEQACDSYDYEEIKNVHRGAGGRRRPGIPAGRSVANFRCCGPPHHVLVRRRRSTVLPRSRH